MLKNTSNPQTGILGSVLGIATAGAVFAALHHSEGQDTGVFALIWGGLAVVAALVVLGGHRSRR